MSQSSSPPAQPIKEISNLQRRKDGLQKIIQSEISLSTSRNPDFVLKHPNELKAKNQNWKKEIVKRIIHEQEVRLKQLDVRLKKKTGTRRIEA